MTLRNITKWHAVVRSDQRQDMAKINNERIAFERPYLNHLVAPAMQLENTPRRTFRAHQDVAHLNGLNRFQRPIEHQDRGPWRMAAGGCHAERVAVVAERSNTALDKGFLAGAQAHDRSPLIVPSSAARGHRGWLLNGWIGARRQDPAAWHFR